MFSLLIPPAALAINVLVQVLCFRRWSGARFLSSIVAGFGGGFAALIAMETALFVLRGSTEQLSVALLVNAPTYAALAYCYYNFAQLGQTSVRIRLYSRISSCPRGLPFEEVSREYAEDRLVRLRLERLVESGDILKVDDRYVIGRARWVIVGRVLLAAKRLLLGRTSEFDKGTR